MKSHASPCPACKASTTERIFHNPYRTPQWYLAICRNCGQHFTDPLPTLADIQGFYAGDYHQSLCASGKAERVFEQKFQRYLRWIVQFVQRGHSLDIGCTTGLFPHLLHQHGFQAEGLEINPDTAQWGRQHYGIPIRNESFETADYDPETFSLVTLTDVLEHTLAPPVALQQVYRVLRPGGFALVTFPDIQSIESRYFHMLASVTRREWLWSTCHIPLHTWEFTSPTATNLFQQAGFNVVGFRRSHPATFQRSSLPLSLLTSPPLLLKIPYLARHCGTQMEFMLQKK